MKVEREKCHNISAISLPGVPKRSPSPYHQAGLYGPHTHESEGYYGGGQFGKKRTWPHIAMSRSAAFASRRY